MNTTYIARKITLPDAFKDKADAKLQKLDKFFGDDAAAEVKVSAQKDTATVELTIRADGMVYRAENTDVDKQDALDAAVDTIVRRIRRNKTRLQKKLKASAFDMAEPAPEEYSYEIVREKEVELRPMSTDEAITQMTLLGHTFFVYQNGDTGAVNVVYRRSDGGYGVIIPK
jgi:putative sigma-54 modulation protein